jgi:hypothetical protein
MEPAEAQVIHHELLAKYWMLMVSTGLCRKRQLFHGSTTSGGSEFTDLEKDAAAMENVLNHIHVIQDLVDVLFKEKAKKEVSRPEEKACTIETTASWKSDCNKVLRSGI